MSKSYYKRILIKLSGEMLSDGSLGFAKDRIEEVASEIAQLRSQGIQVCVVVGGGNFLRGRDSKMFDRAVSDYMGMTATIINALALQDVLKQKEVEVSVYSMLEIAVCDTYKREQALKSLESGAVVIFAGGTGNPLVSTDTAAVIKSIEMQCDLLIKITRAGGVYSSDPKLDYNAKMYNKITYQEMIDKNLSVMDMAAVCIAKEHNLSVIVTAMGESSIYETCCHKGSFTLVY